MNQRALGHEEERIAHGKSKIRAKLRRHNRLKSCKCVNLLQTGRGRTDVQTEVRSLSGANITSTVQQYRTLPSYVV